MIIGVLLWVLTGFLMGHVTYKLLQGHAMSVRKLMAILCVPLGFFSIAIPLMLIIAMIGETKK